VSSDTEMDPYRWRRPVFLARFSDIRSHAVGIPEHAVVEVVLGFVDQAGFEAVGISAVMFSISHALDKMKTVTSN